MYKSSVGRETDGRSTWRLQTAAFVPDAPCLRWTAPESSVPVRGLVTSATWGGSRGWTAHQAQNQTSETSRSRSLFLPAHVTRCVGRAGWAGDREASRTGQGAQGTGTWLSRIPAVKHGCTSARRGQKDAICDAGGGGGERDRFVHLLPRSP